MSVFAWVLAAISTVGVAGFIALCFLAPAVASSIVKIVSEILERLLKTRAGVAVLTAAACLTFGYFFFDYQGAHRVRLEWREANAAAAALVAERDATIASNAKEKADKHAATEVEADKATAEARNAYIADLEKRAASVCVDSDADIKRLPRSR